MWEVVQTQFVHPDIAEGVHSFLEKRPPQFPRLGSAEAHPPCASVNGDFDGGGAVGIEDPIIGTTLV